MYSVMLIDDDLMIRDYLRSVIEWDRLDLRLVCEAGDSETAKDYFQLYKPEIVITDISIPIISGIELAKEFIREDNELRVIVITGLNDFDYIRSSVSLGAIDLLSKPISAEDINQSLEKATSQLRKMRQQEHTSQALNKLLSENQTELRERCVSRLFDHRPELGEENIREQMSLLSLDFPEKNFAAVVLHLESGQGSELCGAAFPTAFRNMLDNALQENGFHAFTLFGQNDILRCLVNWSFENGEEKLEMLLGKLLKEAQFYFQSGFTAGIGGTVSAVTSLYSSAEQAALSLEYADNVVPNITSYANVGRMTNSSQAASEQFIASLTDCVQSYRLEDYKKLLENYFDTQRNIEECREMSMQLLGRLSTLCYSNGVYPWNIINYPATVAELFSAKTPDIICRLLLDTGRCLMDVIFKHRSKSKNQLIHLAKIYIREHLSDPELSLEKVSSHIGLSKVYFCQLFHKEEGISFNNYLNMERIALAKHLLKTGNKKIFEISDEIGYSNPKYFNYVFKHIVGVTPLDFRENG